MWPMKVKIHKVSDIRVEHDPSVFGRIEFTQESSGTESLQPVG